MVRISSVTAFNSGEGTVISYTFSEINENGIPVKQNARKQFIITENQNELEDAVKLLKDAALKNFENTEGD